MSHPIDRISPRECEDHPPMQLSMVLFRTRVHNADHNEQRRGGAYSRGVSAQSAVKTEEWSGSDSRRTNRANHPSKKPLLTNRVLLSGTICSTRESEKNDARLMLAVTDELGAMYGQKKEGITPTMMHGTGQDFRGHKSSYIKLNAIHTHLTTLNNCSCMSCYMY